MREPKLGDILRDSHGTEILVHFVGNGQVYFGKYPPAEERAANQRMDIEEFMEQADAQGVVWK